MHAPLRILHPPLDLRCSARDSLTKTLVMRERKCCMLVSAGCLRRVAVVPPSRRDYPVDSAPLFPNTRYSDLPVRHNLIHSASSRGHRAAAMLQVVMLQRECAARRTKLLVFVHSARVGRRFSPSRSERSFRPAWNLPSLISAGHSVAAPPTDRRVVPTTVILPVLGR